MYDVLTDKKNKKELTKEQISYFVKGVTDESIPDYQISALLMAICINGMTPKESTLLAMEMANSGQKADLSAIKGVVVDKHSSGGVGDKCTLIIGPIVSSFGVPFAKLSGRGLGHTGGTIDKLESIINFNTKYSMDEFVELVNENKIVISGQTGSLAPADKKLYALRDVTATINSIPLIAASIMSKKLASGANNILLDVKCGNGAFMEQVDDAKRLAKLMSDIGKLSGVNIKVFVTDMNQPLGQNVGNSLEVIEAYDTLNGNGPNDLTDICISLSAGMMQLAKLGTYDECIIKAKNSITDGSAMKQFRKMVVAQGGSLDESGRPIVDENVKYKQEIFAKKDGYVCSFDTKEIGVSSLILGAGRSKQDDTIDFGAGIILHKKIADKISKGDKLATIFTNYREKIDEATEKISESINISDKSNIKINKLIIEIID